MMSCLLLLAIAAGAEALPPADVTHAGNDQLAAWLEESAQSNPRLHALHEEWRAALERVPQATSLEDPMFGFTQFVRSDMDQYNVMLEQAFPWFGTLKLRGEQAERMAEAIWMQLFVERNALFLAVKEAYYDYAFIEEQIRVIEEQIDVVAYSEELLLSKYSLALAAQDTVLRIQQERSSLEDMRVQLIQMREPVRAQLNEAIGRPIGEELPPPEPLAAPPPAPSAPLVTAWIRAENPLLRVKEFEIEATEVEIELAELKKYPNFSVRMEYMKGRDPGRGSMDPYAPGRLMAARDLGMSALGMAPINAGTAIAAYELFRFRDPMGDEDSAVGISLNMNVPIWRKRLKAQVREAEYMTRAAELDREAMARELDREARMALFNMQDGQRRMALYQDDLIPKAQQTYVVLQAGYASGGAMVDFLDVLDSIRQLLDYQLEGLRALRDWQSAAANLEYLIGGAWEDPDVQEVSAPVTLQITPLEYEVQEAMPGEAEAEGASGGAD